MAASLPSSFTLADIKELYHLRWGIETSFRDLKYTLGLVDLHGRSDAFAVMLCKEHLRTPNADGENAVK